jgi:hypothetical protein
MGVRLAYYSGGSARSATGGPSVRAPEHSTLDTRAAAISACDNNPTS